MNTRGEQQELMFNTRMKVDVEKLLISINELTNYDLSLVEDETDPPEFVISLKYKEYSNEELGYIHRITNIEAEFLIQNIFQNIKDLYGKDYILKDNYKMEDPSRVTHRSGGSNRGLIRKQSSFSSPIMNSYKEIYAQIRFSESEGRL